MATIDQNMSDMVDFVDNKWRTCLASKDKRLIHKECINPPGFHSDLGGPLIRTYDGFKYCITFLDKKTRYLWVFLIRTKDEAHNAFEKCKALADN